MKKSALISAALLSLLPTVASAQSTATVGSGVMGIVNLLGTVINAIIPLLIGAAIVVFFYGLVEYVWKRKGTQIIWMGLLALFVMVSVWGIVRIAQSTLGIGGVQTLPVPHIEPGAVQGS